MEDIIAGSTEAIDSNLNQVLAKVSPSLLRRRSPSPGNTTAATQQRDSSAGGGSGKKSENFLSPSTAHLDTGSEPDGKNKSSSDCSSSQHSSSPSDNTQVNQNAAAGAAAGALSKSPSTGSVGKTKNKVPNQAKKKSWYSVFYPSYKSRSADFKKLFKDVPDDERLLVGETDKRERDAFLFLLSPEESNLN